MCCKSQPDGRFWGGRGRRPIRGNVALRRANAGMYAKRNRQKSHTAWNRSSRTSYRFLEVLSAVSRRLRGQTRGGDIWTLSQALGCHGCSCPNVGQEDPGDQPLQQPEAPRLLRPGAPPLERARTAQTPPFTSYGLRGVVLVGRTNVCHTHTHTRRNPSPVGGFRH